MVCFCTAQLNVQNDRRANWFVYKVSPNVLLRQTGYPKIAPHACIVVTIGAWIVRCRCSNAGFSQLLYSSIFMFSWLWIVDHPKRECARRPLQQSMFFRIQNHRSKIHFVLGRFALKTILNCLNLQSSEKTDRRRFLRLGRWWRREGQRTPQNAHVSEVLNGWLSLAAGVASKSKLNFLESPELGKRPIDTALRD